MKTSRILAALVTLSATAALASVKLETRTDYENHTFNDDAALKGYSTTQLNRARLNFNHKVNEELSVTASFDALKSATATTAKSKTGAPTEFIDNAFISYSPISNLTISMGKLSAIGGGIENQYNGGDLYLVSELDAAVTASNAGGIGLTYAMGDHTFDFQATNDDATSDQSSNTSPASRSMTGVQYLGMFLDKKLTVIASYHTMKYHNGGASVEDKPINKSIVGVAYDLGMVKLDLDYGMKVDEFNGTTAGKDEHTGFVFAATAPFMEKEKAIVKFESSETKDNGTKQYIYNNVGVAWEHALAEGANFHVAYNSLSRKTDATGIKREEKQLMVGFKLYADIMK